MAQHPLQQPMPFKTFLNTTTGGCASMLGCSDQSIMNSHYSTYSYNVPTAETVPFFDPATIDINTVKDWTGCLQLFFGPGFKALAQGAHPKSKEVDLLDDDHSDPDSHSEDDPSKLSYLTSSGIDYQRVMGCLDRYATDPTDLQAQLRPFFTGSWTVPSLSRQAEKRPADLEEKLEHAEDTAKDAVETQNALEHRLKASDSDFSRVQNELTPKKTARNAGWISGYIFSGLLEVSTSIRLVRRASATRTASNKRSIPTHSRSQQHLQKMFSSAFTQKTGKGKKNDELSSHDLRDQLSEIIYISSHAVALPVKNGPLRAVRWISAEVWSQILSLVNDKDLKSVNYKDLKSVIVANFPGASQQAVRLVWKEITPENNKLVVLYHKAEQHPQALANHIHSLTMTFEAPVLHAIEEFEISCSCDEHITELVEVRRGCYEAGDT
ncbi:hypothetical protein KCU93_g8879, partial [Aureobasidium melanogenum]